MVSQRSRGLMILGGIGLMLLGLVLLPLSCIYLGGSAFVGDGWHARERLKFAQGVEQRLEFEANAGERLRPSIYLLVDRSPFPKVDDRYELDYDLPARWRLLDPMGAELQHWDGPIVDEDATELGTSDVAKTAIIESALPEFEAQDGKHSVIVELGPDRNGKLTVTQPYVLISDRSSPELARGVFAVVFSVVVAIGGVVLMIVGIVTRRREEAARN